MRRDRPPLRRLWRYGRRYRPRIVWATLFSFLNKVFDLAPPFLIGVAVDVVVAGESSALARLVGVESPIGQLWVLAAVTLFMWGMESATEYVMMLLWRNLAQQLQHDLRTETYRHVQGLELAYFENTTTGGLMSVLNDDINQLERFLDVGANDILQLATTVLVLGVFFFAVAPSIAWLAFLPFPIIVWGSLRFQALMAPRYAAVREQVGVLNAQLANNLPGIATIKSFTAEAAEAARVATESERYQHVNRSAIALSSAFVPLIRIAIVLGFTAAMVAGGRLALLGVLSVGLYSTLVYMTQRLLWPLTSLGKTLDLYQRAMASTRRVLDLLDTESGMVDGSRPLPTEAARGELRLEGMSFSYDGNVLALDDLDLVFPAGRTTAIVGATGAGKSTVIRLLLRLYDPTVGRVTLGGVDLRELRLEALRRAIGLVDQDTYLFHGTVLDNLRYGDPDASLEEVWRAADIAEASAFIAQLPQGLDTVVGERGQKLSGGQRQRLSIARAVLKDPPILVLDEATSAVDNETEAAIQRSLARLSLGRTTIVIAHRLSTIRHADRIYVLDSGRVAEMGSHVALLERSGIYANLWRVQTGEQQTAALESSGYRRDPAAN